ncbi:hypothetical protein AALB81_08605 [Lachnospiraceae bacterium 48-33]
MKKKKKIILVTIMMFVTVFIVYTVYFFFGRKKYTFYMKDDAMEIQAIQIYIDEDTNQNMVAQSVIIYKTEVINKILEELKKVKLKPSYSFSGSEDSKKGFSFIFLGKDNKQFSYLASEGKNNYFVDVTMEENGVLDDDGIEYLISFTSILKEQGDKLYDLAKQTLEDNISEITISDIEKMSKEKIYDWNQFQQYLFTDTKSKEITRKELTSNGAARFQIAEKKGYLEVVYFNGIIADSNATNRYAEVLEAVIYNEKGEEMDFYADGISTFLEKME